MLAAPPPGYSPAALNRQAMPNTLGQPGIQSAAVQGHALQGTNPGMGPTTPPMGASSMPHPMPQMPPPAAQRANPWGVLGPQNLNGIVRALGGAKVR